MEPKPYGLPRTLTLPSGRRVTLEKAATASLAGKAAADGEPPRFADALRLLGEGGGEPAVRVVDAASNEAVAVRDLVLADFHVVRAVLTKAKLLKEEDVELDCLNCGKLLVAAPSTNLETGPWEDGELDDPELDQTAELGAPIPTPPIAIGRVRSVRSVTLAQRTVGEARPLFDALARDPFLIDEAVVEGMGIEALGAIHGPPRIARILAECDDASFDAVTDAFLAAHYPLRLACDVFCDACGARNTIDAPALREFERGPLPASGPGVRKEVVETVEPHASAEAGTTDTEASSRVPSLEAFVELAHAIAEPLIDELPAVGEAVELVVEDGTPAVDDGGVPLLGSYLPPPPKDAPVPSRPPMVTIYYRTFLAIERDEGPFDWESELEETIEHELEHHLYFLRGDDPMDEAEHAEIDREAVRVVGRAEATRRTLAAAGLSVPEFFTRAWPLVLLAGIVLAITLAESRCAP